MRYASASKNLPSIEPEIYFPHHNVVFLKYFYFNWKREIKSEKYSDKNLKRHFSRNEKGWYAGQVWQFSLIWEPCCFDQKERNFLRWKRQTHACQTGVDTSCSWAGVVWSEIEEKNAYHLIIGAVVGLDMLCRFERLFISIYICVVLKGYRAEGCSSANQISKVHPRRLLTALQPSAIRAFDKEFKNGKIHSRKIERLVIICCLTLEKKDEW